MRKVATPLIIAEQAAPATPPTAFVAFYAKADGFLYRKDDAGTETQLGRLFIDDDSMATATATNVASAESTKAYVDNSITALDELAAGVRSTINTGTPGFQKVDVSLSAGISSGDTLTGGTGSGEDLTLASTAHATRGTIFVRDIVELLSENKTNTSDTPINIMNVPSSRTITLGNTTSLNPGNAVVALAFSPTILYDENANVFGAGSVFVNGATFKNRNGETRTIYGVYSYVSSPIFQADGATVTLSGPTALQDSPTFSVLSAGVLNVTGTTTITSGATVNTGVTVTTRRGLWVLDSTGAGTVTIGVGVEIDPMSDATTSIGIRNASTTVRTAPTATAITGVSGTIPHNASKINITSNGNYTLTSTPTITDGQHGETLTIMNVDTGSDVVTIQDQGTLAGSNLRLTATTVAIGPRDSIELTFDSTVGDWVQTGPLVTVI